MFFLLETSAIPESCYPVYRAVIILKKPNKITFFFFYPKCRAYKITEDPSAKHKLQRNPIKSVLHTLSRSLYLKIPHRSISFMMEQLQMNLQEPRNSLGGWFPLRFCLSSPGQQGCLEMLSKAAQSINPCGCLKAAQETDPEGFMWNLSLFLQPPFPLLPACPELPAPTKNTVPGWAHLSPQPEQNFLCSFKEKNPSLGAGCLRDELQSSESSWMRSDSHSQQISVDKAQGRLPGLRDGAALRK